MEKNRLSKDLKPCGYKKNFPSMFVVLLVLLLVAFAAAVLAEKNGFKICKDEAGETSKKIEQSYIEDFINNNLVPQDSKVKVKEFTKEDGLYKAVIDVGGKERVSYLSKNGKLFFPNVINVEEAKKESEERKKKAEKDKENQKKEMTKNSKPNVELFVMSYCPYGAQIEKGILPVVKTLGDKINFELKFCSYAMHGKKEIDEQLRQYCVQKEKPDKFLSYLKCFLETGEESNECLTKNGISAYEISSCVSKVDKEYKVTENYANKNTWMNGKFPVFELYKSDNEKYGITGSPSLVINGKKVSTKRDPASLLEIICSAFDSAPEECKSELSSKAFSTGFGFESNSGNTNTNAGCGS